MQLVDGVSNDTVLVLYGKERTEVALEVALMLLQKGVVTISADEAETRFLWGREYWECVGWLLETVKKVVVFTSPGLLGGGKKMRWVYRAFEAGKYIPVLTKAEDQQPAIFADIIPAKFFNGVDDKNLDRLVMAIRR